MSEFEMLQTDIANSLINGYNLQPDANSAEKFVEVYAAQNEGMKEYLSQTEVGKAKLSGYTDTVKNHNKMVQQSTIAYKAKTTAMKSAAIVGNMLAGTLVSIGVSLLIQGLVELTDALIVTREELLELGEQAKSTISEISDNFESHKKTVEEVSKRYEDLKDGVDSLSGTNIGLSDDEYKEFLDISNQLADIFPGLVDRYTENGDAILSIGSAAEDTTKKLNELLLEEQELANFKISQQIPDLYKGIREEVEIAQEELEKLQEEAEGFKNASEIMSGNTSGILTNYSFEIAANGSKEYIKYRDEILKEVRKYASGTSSGYIEDGDGETITIHFSLDDDQLADLSQKLKTTFADSQYSMEQQGNEAAKYAELKAKDIQGIWNQLVPSLMQALNTSTVFTEDLSESMQNAIGSAISTMDLSSIPDSYEGDILQYIKDTIVYPMASAEPDVQQAFISLMSIDPEKAVTENIGIIDECLAKLAEYLKIPENELRIKLGSDEEANGEVALKSAKTKYAGYYRDDLKKSDSEKNANTWLNTLTEEELKLVNSDAFEKAIEQRKEALNGATLQVQDYANALTEVQKAEQEIENSAPATITDSIKQMASQLEPQLAKIGDIYKSIFSEDGSKFNANVIDNNMLSELEQALTNIEGVDFDTDALEDFFSVLADGKFTAQEAKDAFNDLATAWFYSTNTLKNLNSETAESIKQQMEQLGVTNADEVINHYLDIAEAQNELIEMQQELDEARKGLQSDSTAEQESARGLISAINGKITAYYNEIGVTEEVRLALFKLQYQESALAQTGINTQSDCQQLLALARTAGVSAEFIEKLVLLEQMWNTYHDATNAQMKNAIYNKIQQTNAEIESMLANIDEGVELDFDPLTTEAAKAGKDAGEAYKDALEQELSDLDKIIGYIGGLFDDQIDSLENAKDEAIQALEDARDKEIEALEDRKDALEDQKSALEDYKDALEDANRERELAISLQKAQYELERLQNQNTALIYSDSKGFHYENDTSAIRDAKNEVENIELDIKLNEIDEQIESIDEGIEKIDEQIEAVEEKYEKLIEETEKYYDAQIKSLQMLKEQMEAIKETAENQEIIDLLKKYGISVEDILAGNEEALVKLKEKYLEVATALSEYEATGAMEELATSSDNASKSVSKVADATTQIDDTKVANLSSAMDSLGDTSKLDALYIAFDNLKTVIQSISDTLNGVDEAGGLVKALESLGSITSLGTTGEDATGLIGQFVALKNAITDVTTAISGGGDSKGQNLPEGGAPTKQGALSTVGSPDSGETGGLAQAIEEQGEIAEEVLGKEIPLFNGEEDSLLSAVTDVTTAIAGSGESEGSGEEADPTNLKGAIQAQYEKAIEVIPVEKIKFEDLLEVIEACVEGLRNMALAMKDISETSLDGGGGSRGGYKGTVGKAFANGTTDIESLPITGYKGLPHDEKNALRSEYGQPELTVYPDGTTEYTTEPVMSDLPKGTLIYNEEQTKRIMNNKGTIVGKAYATGTLPKGLTPLSIADSEKYNMLSVMTGISSNVDIGTKHLDMLDRNVDTMVRNVSRVNNTSSSVVVENVNVTCPGVTTQEVASQIGDALKREFMGLSLNAYQKSMKR